MSVRLIEPRFVERVWGTTRLSPLFPDQNRKIGEVWFDAGQLSPARQVHLHVGETIRPGPPGRRVRRAVENSRGKTEMWHILAAEPIRPSRSDSGKP